MHLSALYLHPLKSAASLSVEALEVEPRGPRFDRRWLVIDADRRFVTARALSELVLVRAKPLQEGLSLSAPGMAMLEVGAPREDAPRAAVRIWNDVVEAPFVDPAADQWLSAFLQRPVRLVYMDADAHRAVDPAYGRAGDEVSFADGYPLLVISQAALDGLNERLMRGGQAPVTMLHFRPNLVVAGVGAHAEDCWRRVRIADVEFDAVKPCGRCVFTTVDPVLGQRRDDGEPWNVLKDYRNTPTGITFGMNLIPRGAGTLRAGDAVEVLA